MALQFDYQSILNRLLANLSTKTEHKQVLNDSSVKAIMEVVAQEMEDTMSNSEYLTLENNWSLARNKSSLLTESRVHGYKVSRLQGAVGVVKVGVDKDFSTFPSHDIILPQFTQFSNGDLTFVSISNAVLTTLNKFIELNIVQGESKFQVFDAAGDVNEFFIVSNNFIENSLYVLTVNDEKWIEVKSLFDAKSTDKVFEIDTLSDFSGIKLTFGDNIKGKKLSSGDRVKFAFFETQGANGNILVSNSITEVLSPIENINGDSVELFVTNESAITGGKNEASIDEIRNTSPLIFQTGGRASGKVDYEVLIKNFPFVKKVSVWGAYEYLLDNKENGVWRYPTPLENRVQVSVISTSNNELTLSQEDEIRSILNPIKPPEDIITFNPFEIIKIIFNVEATIRSGHVLGQIKIDIDAKLLNAYALDKLSFKQGISESEYIGLIQEAEGVKFHKTKVKIVKDYAFTDRYAVGFKLPLYPLVGNSIEVWKKHKYTDTQYILIGRGDSVGNITNASDEYTFVHNAIDTSTGQGGIIITQGLTGNYWDYEIRIIYELEDDSVELPLRTQIINYIYSEINLTYEV